MNDATIYIITGLAGVVVSLYSGLKYYAISGIGLLTSMEAKKMINRGEIKHIIDVRTKTEYNLGHYPYSKHIPITQLSENKLNKIRKEDAILVYCNTGQRARRAAELIRRYGFAKVYYIEGHYSSIVSK